MIKSMTGYGHYENATEQYRVEAEIKSVNHRYCDIGVKLPRRFNMLEGSVRSIVKEYVGRGKVEVFINFEENADTGTQVCYHEAVAAAYVALARRATEEFGLENDMTATRLLRLPDVVSLEEQKNQPQSFAPVIEQAVREAAERFVQSREMEGKALQEDVLRKLDGVSKLLFAVEERSPKLLEEYREKIKDKVEEFLGEKAIDEAVLATELVVYADKVCVDEETVRLRSHIENMTQVLSFDEPIGRKLDFLAQEMNREANTILSKANDKVLSQTAVDLKTEIEKIREQIQNVE